MGTVTAQVQATTIGASDPSEIVGRVNMFSSGIASFLRLKGDPTNSKNEAVHNIVFDIPFSETPSDDVVVHVSPSSFGNDHAAVDMHYQFYQPQTSTVGTNVRVNVTVRIGDTDGWLDAVSFLCIARRA